MNANSAPVDYARVEIRQGDTTTVYELEGAPNWPLEVAADVDPLVHEYGDGLVVHRVSNGATANLTLSGKLTRGERVTQP